jgi:DnaK suppressor protein
VTGERLEEELAATTHLAQDLRTEAAAIEASTAESPDDEHDAEGSTIGFERARVAGLLARTEATLASIEQAIKRREAGTYETCSACGKRIAPERLQALPATTVCVDCALSDRRG